MNERIKRRYKRGKQDQADRDDKRHRSANGQAEQQTDHTRGDKQPRGQSMGIDPDALAGQRPRRSHADKKVPAHLAQHVSDQGKKQAEAAD